MLQILLPARHSRQGGRSAPGLPVCRRPQDWRHCRGGLQRHVSTEHRQQHTTTLVTQAAREGGGDVRQKRLFYGINSTKILKFYLEPANRQNNYLIIYDILFFVVLLFICLHVVLWLITKCLILLVVMYIYI